MAKDNTIFWIIGMIILAVFLLPKLDGGLFAIGDGETEDIVVIQPIIRPQLDGRTEITFRWRYGIP